MVHTINFDMNMYQLLIGVVFFTILQTYVVISTKLEVSSFTNPVSIGGVLTFQCQIWNLPDFQDVYVFHTLNGKTEQVSVGENVLTEERGYMAKRTFQDGSTSYLLAISNASLTDGGTYTCTVTSFKEFEVETIGKKSLDIKLHHFPDSSYPTCTSNPEQVLKQGKTGIELICLSEKGRPTVQLKWSAGSFGNKFLEANVTKDDHVYSQLFLPTQMEFQNVVFTCEMTSVGFPDFRRSCQIGPISMLASGNTNRGRITGLITETSTIKTNNNARNNDPNIKKSLLLDNCDDICRTKYFSMVYVIIFTVIMSLLALIFLGTTIVLWCKYPRHSSEPQAKRQQEIPVRYTYPRPAEQVYLSMNRNPADERVERVYMTLEDPNSPQDKFVCPRDAFEQYFNRKTLSLRRVNDSLPLEYL